MSPIMLYYGQVEVHIVVMDHCSICVGVSVYPWVVSHFSICVRVTPLILMRLFHLCILKPYKHRNTSCRTSPKMLSLLSYIFLEDPRC